MKKILIVEDDYLIASSIKSTLRRLDYKNTYIANSGALAIKKIEEKHPDLILADIVLNHKMNGIELAKQVKEKYKIPVIFLTAYSDEKTVFDAKLSEPYGFITKPFKIEELRIALEIAFHRSKMEKKLIESEEKYRTLTETIEDVIFTLDPKGKFTFLSPAYEKITGFQIKDYLGHHFKGILGPEYVESSFDKFIRGIAGEEFSLYEIEILHKEKGTIPVEINLKKLYDDNENILGVIGSLRDISERKRSEKDLREAYLQLENTQKELVQTQTLANLGEFAGGIAHEIRNPLANISAIAQHSMKKFTLDKQMINNLDAIIDSSKRANRIIKDLLNFAKPHKLQFASEDIIQTINRVCKLSEAKRLNRKVRLYKRYAKNLPQIVIDEKQMKQAFMNIIMNSIDAMKNGGRLSIEVFQEDEFIVVKISDTGEGVATKNIDKLFNPFFTLKPDGVGLGLSVTHRIIQSHNGSIEVESVYHKGTKFTVRLPIMNKNE